MTTITYSAGIITPTAVEGFRASRPIRNLVQEVLDRAEPDIDFRPAGLRTGTFRLVFDGEAAALTAFDALAREELFTIANGDVDGLNMKFAIPEGDLDLEQDDTVVTMWRIQVPFQEVTA
ncbi:hypothetical protein [Microbacterium maritypicum]|uniref:hypothetical protein n=1 Tax=Microbacterium maritypicum TaxID=33918 RepID=UPI003807FADA